MNDRIINILSRLDDGFLSYKERRIFKNIFNETWALLHFYKVYPNLILLMVDLLRTEKKIE